jgi:hypothetical protein
MTEMSPASKSGLVPVTQYSTAGQRGHAAPTSEGFSPPADSVIALTMIFSMSLFPHELGMQTPREGVIITPSRIDINSCSHHKIMININTNPLKIIV